MTDRNLVDAFSLRARRAISALARSGNVGAAALKALGAVFTDRENLERLMRWRQIGKEARTAAEASSTVDFGPLPDDVDVRLYSWQLSYFSGKVRSYLTCEPLRESSLLS